jgi:hypothetical protein
MNALTVFLDLRNKKDPFLSGGIKRILFCPPEQKGLFLILSVSFLILSVFLLDLFSFYFDPSVSQNKINLLKANIALDQELMVILITAFGNAFRP